MTGESGKPIVVGEEEGVVEVVYNRPPNGILEYLRWVADGNANKPTTLADRLKGTDVESALWNANRVGWADGYRQRLMDVVDGMVNHPVLTGTTVGMALLTVLGSYIALRDPSLDRALSVRGGQCEGSLIVAEGSCSDSSSSAEICRQVAEYRKCLIRNGVGGEGDMPSVDCKNGEADVTFSDSLLGKPDYYDASPTCDWSNYPGAHFDSWTIRN